MKTIYPFPKRCRSFALVEGKLTPYRVRRAFSSRAADIFLYAQMYQNPVDGHLDGPKVTFLALHLAIRL